jgi:hypothetical protein
MNAFTPYRSAVYGAETPSNVEASKDTDGAHQSGNLGAALRPSMFQCKESARILASERDSSALDTLYLQGQKWFRSYHNSFTLNIFV